MLYENITEKEVAKASFISETHLRNLYNRYFGMPPKRYIKFIKLKKGQTLLRITRLSVSEIAHILGYINVSKFSSEFKKIYNMTPSQYREKCAVLE